MDPVLTVYRFTLSYAERLLADIDDARLADVPAPGMNHPAWIAGHLALANDLGVSLLGGDVTLETSRMALFGPGSTPTADRDRYPSKDVLLADLRRTHVRVLALVPGVPDSVWKSPNPTRFFPETFPTVGDLATHLMTSHGSLHLGQLSAWRRHQGLPGVLGI